MNNALKNVEILVLPGIREAEQIDAKSNQDIPIFVKECFVDSPADVVKIRKCYRCKAERIAFEFHRGRNECKECARKRYQENKGRILGVQAEYRKNNPDKVRETQRRHKEEHHESIKASKRKYNNKNKEKLAVWHKEDRKVNKQKYSEDRKRYYQENEDAKRAKSERNKKWWEDNRDKWNKLDWKPKNKED